MIKNISRGFTLVELLISIGIVSVLMLAIGAFGRNVFFFNAAIQADLDAQLGARAALRRFSADTREASPSSLGAFPIAEAATSSFVFYSDTDNDGIKEKIRYFLSGTDLKRGVTVPSGNPLVYDSDEEELSTVVSDIVNGTSSPVFEYYGSTYDGTLAPYADPVSPANVKLVKITLLADSDPNRAPDAFVFTTQVSLRNLKDNY